jgi:hypothetical protein
VTTPCEKHDAATHTTRIAKVGTTKLINCIDLGTETSLRSYNQMSGVKAYDSSGEVLPTLPSMRVCLRRSDCKGAVEHEYAGLFGPRSQVAVFWRDKVRIFGWNVQH